MRRHYEVAGKKEGLMTDYYPDGAVKGERMFVNDQQHGRAVWYYPNGTKQEVQFFEDGVQTGPDTLWMEDGSLQRVIHFENGMKEGPMRTWQNGEVILEVMFSADTVVQVTKSPGTDSTGAIQ